MGGRRAGGVRRREERRFYVACGAGACLSVLAFTAMLAADAAPRPSTRAMVLVPAALVVLALGVVVRGIWRLRRARLQWARGLCARCGYDLRATPDRCPECGLVPAP